MDFTPIIAPIWSFAGWLIPFMLVIVLLKSPWAKG
ncbi:nuclease, partial [Pseudomonas sp. BAgro211]|nr:nuclease [Pseudomonas sp. BAgro211]